MLITRRGLLKGAAALGLAAPAARAYAWIPDRPSPKTLAEAALGVAMTGGASYADVRLVRLRREAISSRDDHVTGVNRFESFGLGVRVLKGGAWGFSATPTLTAEKARRAAQRALAIATANAAMLRQPIRLAPEPPHQDSWQTPIEKDPFRVPLQVKTTLLLEANKAARSAGSVRAFTGNLVAISEEKTFYSSEGSAIEQQLFRTSGGYQIVVADDKSGRFEQRNHPTEPMSAGFEHIERARLIEDAPRLTKEALEKLTADPPAAGPRDLVLDSSHLWLTIHESIGHSTELDRVLGYEANMAGTSFATTDKLGTLRYGGPNMTIYADRTTPGGLATCGYDDDGVSAQRWDLIKDGVLVSYQTVRDQLGLAGFTGGRSSGCSYADSWASVPFQRMPNVSLAPGKAPLTLAQLIQSTQDGIYIQGTGSYSIDHQRKNFQFGGDFFWEIKNGKLTRPLRDVAYQSNTLEFWPKMDAICDASEWRMYGSLFDGKGEPGQANPVSHGCAPARFRQVAVLDVSGSPRS